MNQSLIANTLLVMDKGRSNVTVEEWRSVFHLDPYKNGHVMNERLYSKLLCIYTINIKSTLNSIPI